MDEQIEQAKEAPVRLTDEQAEQQARLLLAEEYERKIGDGPFPTYAGMARRNSNSFTLCAVRAVKRALLSQQAAEPTDLNSIERYRLQMAGISTAALGYWKEGDGINPDYDTPALHDVAALYAKYDELYKQVHDQPAAAAGAEPTINSRLSEIRSILDDTQVDYSERGMGCGLEDRGITDRYEAMRYGWDEAIDRMHDEIIKHAIDAIDQLLAAAPSEAQAAPVDDRQPAKPLADDSLISSIASRYGELNDPAEFLRNGWGCAGPEDIEQALKDLRDTMQMNHEAALAALSQQPAVLVPDGWALVPLKPTEEMQQAWDKAPFSEDIDEEFRGAYRAMINAAPTAPTQEDSSNQDGGAA